MDKKQQNDGRGRQRKNHTNLSHSNIQFSGVEFNDDAQDDFYEPMDKSMGGYGGGHMGGPQNYSYYGQRGGNYSSRYDDYGWDGPNMVMWNEHRSEHLWRGKDTMTFSLNY